MKIFIKKNKAYLIFRKLFRHIKWAFLFVSSHILNSFNDFFIFYFSYPYSNEIYYTCQLTSYCALLRARWQHLSFLFLPIHLLPARIWS